MTTRRTFMAWLGGAVVAGPQPVQAKTFSLSMVEKRAWYASHIGALVNHASDCGYSRDSERYQNQMASIRREYLTLP
jgi:hypothetical protein